MKKPTDRYISVLCFIPALLFSICLTSCSTDSERLSANSGSPIPNFSGAWAQEFRHAYEELAPTDEIRSYLADEKISDAELATVLGKFRGCLEAQGISVTDLGERNSELSWDPSIPHDEKWPDSVYDPCAKETGYDAIFPLYLAMKSNPNNEDLTKEIVACYVRAGIVAPDFSVEDYRRSPVTEFPGLGQEKGRERLEKCNSDPKISYAE